MANVTNDSQWAGTSNAAQSSPLPIGSPSILGNPVPHGLQTGPQSPQEVEPPCRKLTDKLDNINNSMMSLETRLNAHNLDLHNLYAILAGNLDDIVATNENKEGAMVAHFSLDDKIDTIEDNMTMLHNRLSNIMDIVGRINDRI